MTDQNIECEIRSFISSAQFDRLADYFRQAAKFNGDDEQVTYYFDCPQDLRIQQNSRYAKVWLKHGQLHDEQREEIEIKFPREDFEKMEQLFLALGYGVEIKWFRRRLSFTWGDIEVSLDHTRGYGRIIELEIMSSTERQEEAVAHLKDKLAELAVPLTPKSDFDEKYRHYQANWQQLIAVDI
ncbi:MAG: CYTH domain-containing protein [Patescibacteria group bacterium]